jgi:hypothetical protein
MVFSFFFTSCIEAGPKYCYLAGLNKTAAELEQDTWRFFDSFRDAPMAVGANLLDVGSIKSLMIGTLKANSQWEDIAAFLAVMMYGSEVQKQAAVDYIVSKEFDGPADRDFPVVEGLLGIHCGDRLVRAQSFEDAAPALAELSNTSRLVGDTVQWITTHCAQWPWHAKETYKGDFQVETKHPILLVSNSRDAHTPLRSAMNVSSGFEGSRVLEINGTGVSCNT